MSNPITELTAKQQAFFDEYVSLCRKHGMMVLSGGEQVTIGDYPHSCYSDDDPWGVRESTIHDMEFERRMRERIK